MSLPRAFTTVRKWDFRRIKAEAKETTLAEVQRIIKSLKGKAVQEKDPIIKAIMEDQTANYMAVERRLEEKAYLKRMQWLVKI